MRSRKPLLGFTLVELIVVVLILGIIATIAVPKLIGDFGETAEATARKNLNNIRDALELYYVEWETYPRGKGAPIEKQILGYLHGNSFPQCPVGNKNNDLRVVATGPWEVSGPEGWAYDPRKGAIMINSNAPTESDPTEKYSEW